MNNTLNNIVIFAAGAAIGSVVTWRFLKTKYEKLANEEIESVKEIFSKNEENATITEEKDINTLTTIKNYVEQLKNEEYVDYSKSEDDREEVEDDMDEPREPYVISPDEYGDLEDYDLESLTYYADGVLADEDDNKIIDVEDLVGPEALNSFGEYEDHSVFVRNEKYMTDYEILLDDRSYSTVIKAYELAKRLSNNTEE